MKETLGAATSDQGKQLAARPTAYIIGQSNSVMREGFARSMQESGPLCIRDIKAVGSSASLLANFFVSELTDSAVDYCIFDLNVYDRYLVYMGYYKLEHMMRYIDSALIECRALNIEPIFALLPSPEFNERTLDVYNKQIEIALKREAFYFDGLTWLAKTMQISGGNIAEAFADVNHLIRNTLRDLRAIYQDRSLRFMFSEMPPARPAQCLLNIILSMQFPWSSFRLRSW